MRTDDRQEHFANSHCRLINIPVEEPNQNIMEKNEYFFALETVVKEEKSVTKILKQLDKRTKGVSPRRHAYNLTDRNKSKQKPLLKSIKNVRVRRTTQRHLPTHTTTTHIVLTVVRSNRGKKMLRLRVEETHGKNVPIN